jgi:hypothetical protein
MRKKGENLEIIEEDYTLSGDRMILFERMRKLYPKGKIEAQKKFCYEISVYRIDHYLNQIFNRS